MKNVGFLLGRGIEALAVARAIVDGMDEGSNSTQREELNRVMVLARDVIDLCDKKIADHDKMNEDVVSPNNRFSHTESGVNCNA